MGIYIGDIEVEKVALGPTAVVKTAVGAIEIPSVDPTPVRYKPTIKEVRSTQTASTHVGIETTETFDSDQFEILIRCTGKISSAKFETIYKGLDLSTREGSTGFFLLDTVEQKTLYTNPSVGFNNSSKNYWIRIVYAGDKYSAYLIQSDVFFAEDLPASSAWQVLIPETTVNISGREAEAVWNRMSSNYSLSQLILKDNGVEVFDYQTAEQTDYTYGDGVSDVLIQTNTEFTPSTVGLNLGVVSATKLDTFEYKNIVNNASTVGVNLGITNASVSDNVFEYANLSDLSHTTGVNLGVVSAVLEEVTL